MIRARLTRLRQRGLSTQVYLVALAVALIGPGLIFTGILLARYAALDRVRFEQDARENVRGLSLTVDRDLAGLISVLQTLATSPHLRDGQFGAFEQQARAVKADLGLGLSLRRPDGTQLVNTVLPQGTPLPQAPEPTDAELLAGRRPLVTGARPGAAGGPPTFTVSVPVVIDGTAAFILSFKVPVERLYQILATGTERGWTTGIVDSAGIILARSADQETLAGQPTFPACAAARPPPAASGRASTASAARCCSWRPAACSRAGRSPRRSRRRPSRRRCGAGSGPISVSASWRWRCRR